MRPMRWINISVPLPLPVPAKIHSRTIHSRKVDDLLVNPLQVWEYILAGALPSLAYCTERCQRGPFDSRPSIGLRWIYMLSTILEYRTSTMHSACEAYIQVCICSPERTHLTRLKFGTRVDQSFLTPKQVTGGKTGIASNRINCTYAKLNRSSHVT